MKRLLALLLIFALLVATFAACRGGDAPEETQALEEIAMDMEKPSAMVSFGDSGISGISYQPPEDLTVVGESEVKTVSVLVGDNDGEYTVRTLGSYGSEMTFTITDVTPNTPAMIDIEEVHLRADDPIAYVVYVNGVEVYGRTYDPIADGPNHAYFDVSADVVGASDKLTVRIVSKTDAEIRFRRVWAVSDPEKTAQEQGIDKKMDVVLMLTLSLDNLNYAYLKSLVESYQCDGMYNVGLCWEINHLQWGKEKTEQYLNNLITLSLQTGAVLYLGINTWWGGTASGPDGLGGMWQDVPYQQITYDKNNTDGRGIWQLSSPNEFSDTPWLSMNNDYYNEVRVQRIKETVEFIQLRTAELALAGQDLPAIHLYTENEPYYWPIYWKYYDFDNTPNGVGDFSAWVIADAAADGITLDPTDGLSQEEAFWMYRNLHTYISEVGQAMADGLGYNYITVKNGEITYPTDQIVENSYSHTPIHYIYPNWDENQRSWENHVLDSIHFGGEWSIYQEKDNVRALDYLLAYGSFANINAERLGFPGGYAGNDFRVLSQCYAFGLEGVIIYNVQYQTDQQNVIDESEVEGTLMEVRHYDLAPLYESDFSQRTAYSVNKVLVGLEGLRWDGTAVMPNGESGGSLTYRMTNAGDYATGLRVGVSGKFNTDNGRLEILVGTSLDNLQSVGVYNSAEQSVDIDPSLYAGSDDVYIRIRIFGEDLTSAQASGLCVSKIGIYRSATETGCTDGSIYTYAQNRIRCQIIAARADAERLMSDYLEKGEGQMSETQRENFINAYGHYISGNYGQAYSTVSQAISQLLPATFTVSGYGQLGEYPIEIKIRSDAKITVCLKEVSDETVRFSLSSSGDDTVTISLLTDSGKWSMTQLDDGDWVISAGDTAAADGKVSFTMEVQQRVAKEYPSEFEARLLVASSDVIYVQSQDTAVTDYCHNKGFQVAADAVIYRGADGTAREDMTACKLAQLKAGDYVQVKLNDDDRVTEIYAWYGEITGEVIKVEEMSVHETMSNAFVTIRAADGTTKLLEIGYDTLLNYTGATGAMGKLALVDSIGLEVGQKVTATYCPYTVNDRTRAIEISD